MNYETIQDLKPEDFKRLTGVRPETFKAMLEVLTENTRLFGRPRKLTLADHLLVTLLYWREYRTLFHLGQQFGVSEATVSRIVQKVEETLIASERFRLPGKKALLGEGVLGDGTEFEVVIVDATECPVERPKKNNGGTTPGRSGVTLRKPNS
jgi:hypothetical protein